jgi:signal peptidase II
VRPPFSRIIWLTAWTIWLFDYATKAWALIALDNEPKKILGTLLQFTLVKNSGAAFNLAGSFTVIFSVIAVLVIATIVRYAHMITSRGWLTCAGLLLGGVLGNLTDRIFREPGFFIGHVVDWIQIPHWPVFNIADSAITVAALIAVIQTMRNVPPVARVQ